MVTFYDLVELMMIRDLVEVHGLKVGEVRDAVQEAVRRTGVQHPLASKLMYIMDGGSLCIKIEGRSEQILSLNAGGQLNLREIVERRLRQLDYDLDNMARRWWPMGHEGGISIEPEIGFGGPVVAHTGVSTEMLYQAVMAEGSVERVARAYGLSESQVSQAIDFERSLAA